MTKTVHQIVWDDAYIATAQRVMIARHWFSRFVYQTWWAWWIPRFVIVGFIGWLVATGVKFDRTFYAYVGGFLLLHLFGEYWAHKSLARARARNRNRGSTTTVTMSDEGICIVGALGSSQLKWRAPRSITVKPDGVLLMISNLSGMWLPDTSLAEGARDEVRQLICSSLDTDSTRR